MSAGTFSDRRLKTVLAGLVLASLIACGQRVDVPAKPDAVNIGTSRIIHVATSRARDGDGAYTYRRSRDLDFLEVTVSIPPTHQPGELSFGRRKADPERDFVIAERRKLSGAAAFRSGIDRELASLPPAQQELTIFVHGFNSTQSETAYRAAQVAEDVAVPGLMAIYSWPSRGQPLGYVYDHDSMLFARDGLEDMLLTTAETRAKRVLIVAHSMGALLTLEALRQLEIADPGWTRAHIGGVVLIAPDVDVEVFRAQAARMDSLPQPFLIFVSRRDKALSLSSFLRGTPDQGRLGNLEAVDRLADLPITIIDTTAYTTDASSSHMVPVTSPSLVALLREAGEVSHFFDNESSGLGLLDASELSIFRGGTEGGEAR